MTAQTRTADLPEGRMAVQVFHPAQKGGKTGVILYMDAFGPRPALAQMAERFAALGHVVLLPDLFYRFGAYGPFEAATAFSQDASRAALMRMITGTSQAQTLSDTEALLAMLAEEGASGPVAAIGYCMGGARALNAAASFAERIRAVASLHGGNLASEAADSPHLRVAQITGKVYVGSAGVDGSFPPPQSARLAQALREAEVDHVLENYKGMAHGWCVPDSAAFNAAGAERHWRRLEALLSESL